MFLGSVLQMPRVLSARQKAFLLESTISGYGSSFQEDFFLFLRKLESQRLGLWGRVINLALNLSDDL